MGRKVEGKDLQGERSGTVIDFMDTHGHLPMSLLFPSSVLFLKLSSLISFSLPPSPSCSNNLLVIM